MKVTIITVCYNSSRTIADCIKSVEEQSYKNIEHIIVDGGSTDNTIDIIQQTPNRVACLISEPDNGIYDAMNKGINRATGDVIGFLNSDDYYKSSEFIEDLVKIFIERGTDCVLGNVKIVDFANLSKTKRNYRCPLMPIKLLKYGIMPPHPAFFVKKVFYVKFGLFKPDYKIAGDFELVVRYLFTHKISYYITNLEVTMRDGGVSNSGFKSKRIITEELLKACKENGISTNKLLLNMRYFYKLKQMIFTN